ncbi:hypothetical protein ACD631_17865 [Alteromonas macleodii]|uniref:hypothetical protein n=1 Tax=Alteromonas macleodii TaxID=28108 RepID=UPI0020767CE3|nr:hypothetical protein [Alteromonas macleodii]USI28209.1 hypothetical protein NFG60_00550 [Alteromonas macleodii]
MSNHWFEEKVGYQNDCGGYLVRQEYEKPEVIAFDTLSELESFSCSNKAVVFYKKPLSSIESLEKKFDQLSFFNAPSCNLSSQISTSKEDTLIQLRGRGKTQESVEVNVYELDKVLSFQPGIGRLVCNDKALIDTFIMETKHLAHDSTVHNLIEKAKFVLCRTNHSIQYEMFWKAIDLEAAPIFPEAPKIKSYALQPVMDALFSYAYERYQQRDEQRLKTLDGLYEFQIALVKQLKWHYSDGLSNELLELVLDDWFRQS